jgi:basic membrane lipoprotein Med (substrate-binding protein (PBP1-ABC) superfamily)
MKKTIFLIPLCIIVLYFISSCSRRNEVIFFAEKYWWNVIDQESNLSQTLNSICTQEGFYLKTVITEKEENYADELMYTASSGRANIIITGPMLAYDVDMIAAEFTDKLFIVIGASDYSDFTSPNVLAVSFDYTSAYYRVGQMVSSLLHPDYYYMYETLQEKKVGIIYSLETDKAREYVDNFKQGFLEEQDAEEIIVEAPENAYDRVQALRAVENLSAQDVKIFLLKNYSLIPACIQKISDMDAYYIIEDWQYLSEYASHLLLSIEEDIPAAVERALHSIKIEDGKIVFSRLKRIYISCRLYWGKAINPPAEFKNEITLLKTEAD